MFGCHYLLVSAIGTSGHRVPIAASALSAVGLGVIVVLAVRADAAAPLATPGMTAVDIMVGLVFIAAAAVAPGQLVERGLVAGVGIAWLVSSFLPAGLFVHQALLAVALTAFPAARVRGMVSWLLVGLATLVGFGLLPRLGVAMLFVAVAVLPPVTSRRDRVGVGFTAVAAAGVAVALTVSWSADRFLLGGLDPTVTLLGYEAALLLVAAAFPFAARAELRAREKLADEFLYDARLEGLEGLAAVLQPALRDPDLQLYRWQDSESSYVDGRNRPIEIGGDERHWLPVEDQGGRIAAVAHRSPALDDAATAAAVASAVRLVVTQLRLQEEQRRLLGALEASRARIVAAADGARESAAAELRENVGVALRLARSELSASRSAVREPDVSAALDVVVEELAAASREITELVSGVPPAPLGGGRLADAIVAIAERSSIPVSVSVEADTTGSGETEAALFYVCCEALANAVKHAHAHRVTIFVRRSDGAIVASVTDDGNGGADPSGSGLQGLADRLATRKGRLRVDSTPGAGTTVTAAIPD